MNTERKVSWDEIFSLCNQLAWKILNNDNNYKGIYGVPCGGIVPALILSQMTRIPFIGEFKATKDILVVEEIVDTGRTLKSFQKYGMDLVCLYKRKGIEVEGIKYFCSEEDEATWLIFPWDNEYYL